MATNYNFFQSLQTQSIITNAYRKIGISGYDLVPDQLDAARDNINFLFTQWSNDNVNLWTLQTFFLSLQPGVYQYTLPIEVQTVIQCELRTSSTQAFSTAPTSGTAFALNADDNLDPAADLAPANQASNVFDGLPNTTAVCTQTAQRGNIGWNFGLVNGQPVTTNNQQINFVGIQSNAKNGTIYNINVEASNGGNNWTLLLNLGALAYNRGVTQWFEIANNIATYQYYRISEVTEGGAAVPLNLQQLYFNNNIIDYTMTNVSRYDYLSYPQKQQLGRPTVYYVSYKINPVIYLWQNPNTAYNCIMYSAQLAIPLINAYTDSLPIPPSFYEALINGLAWKLATIYNPQIAAERKAEYQESLQAAIIKDSETVPLVINPYGS